MKPAEDVLDRLTQAWATGQGTKVAACFSTAGRFIAFDGSSHDGRDQIASFHQMAFDGPLRGTRLEMAIADCRELPGDLILISTRGGVRKSESTDLDRAGESIQSLLAKQGHQDMRSSFCTMRAIVRSGMLRKLRSGLNSMRLLSG